MLTIQFQNVIGKADKFIEFNDALSVVSTLTCVVLVLITVHGMHEESEVAAAVKLSMKACESLRKHL
jgi:hypothetical protein